MKRPSDTRRGEGGMAFATFELHVAPRPDVPSPYAGQRFHRRRLCMSTSWRDALPAPRAVQPASDRPRLDRELAVLLMRSSYETADSLDFVAMDEFQRRFFLLRADEYERYRKHTYVAQQGELTDPAYFDFISFAQYATISELMRHGEEVFVERTGATGEKHAVRRDARLKDNSMLPIEFSKVLGNRLLSALTAMYVGEAELRTVTSAAGSGSFGAARYGLPLLYECLRRGGFCQAVTDYLVEDERSGQSRLRICTHTPANLWGNRYLRRRRDAPANDFDVFMAHALLRRIDVTIEKTTTRYLTERNAIEREYVFSFADPA